MKTDCDFAPAPVQFILVPLLELQPCPLSVTELRELMQAEQRERFDKVDELHYQLWLQEQELLAVHGPDSVQNPLSSLHVVMCNIDFEIDESRLEYED